MTIQLPSLILIGTGLAWYVACELWLYKTRRQNNCPTARTFLVGILQTLGPLILILAAIVLALT